MNAKKIAILKESWRLENEPDTTIIYTQQNRTDKEQNGASIMILKTQRFLHRSTSAPDILLIRMQKAIRNG